MVGASKWIAPSRCLLFVLLASLVLDGTPPAMAAAASSPDDSVPSPPPPQGVIAATITAAVAAAPVCAAEEEQASMLQRQAGGTATSSEATTAMARSTLPMSPDPLGSIATEELGGGATRRLGATPRFLTAKASKRPPVAFDLRSRVYVPFGVGEGFGFGMGAAEQVSYDAEERFLYAVSERGALNVVDYSNASAPSVVPGLAIDLPAFVPGGTPADVEVCRGLLFVSVVAADKVEDGTVLIFSAVERANPTRPESRANVTVGPSPDHILPNADCTVLAVANEGEGSYGAGLRDPEGSVDLISNLHGESPTQVEVHRVSLRDLGDDKDLIKVGVHLPLTLKAMVYWQEFSGLKDVNFTEARTNYRTAINLEPEYLGWSGDGRKLFVNLQENNALVTIEFSKHGQRISTRIDALGLKDWSSRGGTDGLDLVEDGDCQLAKYNGFFSLRLADSIAVVNIDGRDFILAANEGDDKEYGDFEELQKEDEVLDKTGQVLLPNMVATRRVVRNHKSKLARGAEPDTRIGLGSTAVDYSIPGRPVLHRLVSHGARGISIYRADRRALKLAWDSGSDFEREQCAAFPWAHNGIQDEEFAPVNGVLYNVSDEDVQAAIEEKNNNETGDGCADGGDGNPGACPLGQTVDERSPKDGAAPEAVVAGAACGRLLAVAATEKQSSALVYDITVVSRPRLLFVRHLSPASEVKNPGVAYGNRSLGEIDPESLVFLEAQHSPSGKPGVLFAGALSGTVSFWEFSCQD